MNDIKKKQKNKNSIGEIITKIGLIIIMVSAILSLIKIFIDMHNDYLDNKKIKKYYEIKDDISFIRDDNNSKEEIKQKNNEEYIAVIKIPNINLEKGIYAKESNMNKVDKGIQILEKSDYPDVIKGNFILAAHSGTSRISYFKNISKLTMNDIISIDYNSKTYKYKITNIYDVEKTGKVTIKRNKDKTTLTLITCKDNTNKQLIVISELID